MRRTARAALFAGVGLLAGCGGAGGSGGGGLNFRALWQQDGAGSAALVRATTSEPKAASTFAPALPASVKTVRIAFVSDSGFACCSAINPSQLPTDSTGHADLTLSDLPGGHATLTVAGFATDFAPAPAGATAMCPTLPESAGQACDTTRSASPNYASNPQRVVIVPGQETDAGDIMIFAVPGSGPCTDIGAPAPTPSSGGAPPATIIVRSGANIAAAAASLPPGSTLIVGPGVYAPVILGSGALQGPITLLADVTGTLTQSVAAPVTISAHGSPAGIELTGQNGVIVDGFQVQGSSGSGILVQHSSAVTVRNCIVTGSSGDGIHVSQSDQSMVFDNLSYANAASGIQLQCTSSMAVINNTVYGNRDNGILIGQSQPTLVENNITDANVPAGFAVNADSTTGYQTDFNLNTDGYAAGTPIGARDINQINSPAALVNPLFIAPTLGDFHLQTGLAGSTSPAVDAGAPNTDADLVSELSKRSTQTNGTLDTPPIDLGFHYASTVVPATPVPTATPKR